jgi:choline dehydrogenase
MYDTIIVGAGSAGCVLANRLSVDPARKVLVLEAGRQPPLASDIPSDWVTMFNTSVDWGYHTEPQDGCRGRRVFWPRGKMVGGSGALNAMIYIRGLPSDYDGWEKAGCEGWGWKDVLL